MKSDRFKNILGFILTIIVGLASSQSLAGQYWVKTFGGSLADRGYSVQQTTDGGYIIAGNTNSFGAGQSDVYLIYYNPADLLSNGVPLTGLSDFLGSIRYYRIEVPEGAHQHRDKTVRRNRRL